MSALERAVGMSQEYRHVEKIVCPEPSLALDGAVLKWYDIAPDDEPVPLAIRALARRSLRDASRTRALGDLGELGFVVLHRCGASFYFLLAAMVLAYLFIVELAKQLFYRRAVSTRKPRRIVPSA